MKKQFVAVIAIVIVLLATPFTALAQGYSFSLDKENVIVFLKEDNSISLDYTFAFTNDSGAHAIDFVDVGMPNGSFDIGSVAAEVNGTPVDVSTADYQGSGSGLAVVLGSEAIRPGEAGTVHVTVERVTPVLDRDSQDAKYASFDFSPTWFGSEFVHGSTDLTVTFHLPPGIQTDEPRFHVPSGNWTGAQEPVTETDEQGRIVYTWHAENANGYTAYVFGASFPLSYVPVYATQLAQPTIPPFSEPVSPVTAPETGRSGIPAWFIVIGLLVLILAAASLRNRVSESADDRLDYAPPRVAIEGYGIRRGLTAVEAAIMLEQPLEKILTMILFGLVKKGAVKIAKRDPLQLDIAADLQADLYVYEKEFLDAFRIEDPREREESLHEMFVGLIKSVDEKLKGFSRDETQRYYRGMMQRAWQQVQEAGTPELKNQEFDQSFDWLMLDHHFGEDVQKLFENPGMAAPQWWNAYDPDFKVPGHLSTTRNDSKIDLGGPIFQSHSEPFSTPRAEPLPVAKEVKPASPSLPGAEYAASIVNSVQDFSSRAIHDMGKFSERIHKVTDLQPIYSYWQMRKTEASHAEREGSHEPDGGFLGWLAGSGSDSSQSSSSSSHSSSHSCACACACAGCACACAGGGR